MADRFYCPGPWSDGHAELCDDEAHHLARVRRVGVGERVSLFDGTGRSAVAEVLEIGRDRVSLRVVAEGGPDRALAGPLILVTAVPKGDRFDWLVEKATELGVTRLVPLITERSAVNPRSTKLDRLRRVIIEASKQSGRNRLMHLDPPTRWSDWLCSHRSSRTSYITHPSESSISDRTHASITEGIEIAIGPEGGFTESEIAEAVAVGYQAIGLGPTILRVETAALAACAAVLARSPETEHGEEI